METKKDSIQAGNPCAGCTPAGRNGSEGDFPCMCCIAEQEKPVQVRQLELFGND